MGSDQYGWHSHKRRLGYRHTTDDQLRTQGEEGGYYKPRGEVSEQRSSDDTLTWTSSLHDYEEINFYYLSCWTVLAVMQPEQPHTSGMQVPSQGGKYKSELLFLPA